MMCFICHQHFSLLTLLIKHFKRKHDLGMNSTFRCCENDCGQVFQNICSFRKHMNRKHLSDSYFNATVVDINESPAISSYSNSSFENVAINITTEVPISNQFFSKKGDNTEHVDEHTKVSQFEIREFQETLTKAAAEFVLSLHNNNNFSRKDVYEIQKFTQNFIIEPLLRTFRCFAEYHLQNTISTFNNSRVYYQFVIPY